jgi:hypothetical protein
MVRQTRSEALEKFRQRLETSFIAPLCARSKKLYLDINKLELVFSYYEEYRKRIHDSMHLSISPGKKDLKMDRHKVATAFLCSILKAKPIGYNTDGSKASTFLERTANEQLALHLGVFIIRIFNVSSEEASPEEMDIYHLPILFPEIKYNIDDEYSSHFIKLIYDRKIKDGLDFDKPNFNITLLFYLSHIFFLIDSCSFYRNAFLNK